MVRVKCAWGELLHPASTGSLLRTGLGETDRFGLAVLGEVLLEQVFHLSFTPEICWLLGVLGFCLLGFFKSFAVLIERAFEASL